MNLSITIGSSDGAYLYRKWDDEPDWKVVLKKYNSFLLHARPEKLIDLCLGLPVHVYNKTYILWDPRNKPLT